MPGSAGEPAQHHAQASFTARKLRRTEPYHQTRLRAQHYGVCRALACHNPFILRDNKPAPTISSSEHVPAYAHTKTCQGEVLAQLGQLDQRQKLGLIDA